MTKPTVAVLTALLALGFTVAHVTSTSANSARGPISGTATAVYVHPTGIALVLRTAGNHLTDLTIPAHAAITTSDGHAIAPSNIVLGDKLVVNPNGTARDLSQRLVTFKGIVSVAPLSAGDPLIVQASLSSSVLIDLSAQTKYSDTSGETSKLSQLADADQVQVHGLLDTREGEITQAQSVARLGPFHKKGAGTTK